MTSSLDFNNYNVNGSHLEESITSLDKDKALCYLKYYIEDVMETNIALIKKDLKFLDLAEEQSESPFYCDFIPNIKWQNFLSNIINDFKLNSQTILAIRIYLELLAHSNNFLIIENNIHR